MTELVTSADMQAIEREAISSGDVTGLGLMEIAGRGVIDAMYRWRPELKDNRYTATILCGPGNNGGDGYVIARLLKTRGWKVRVLGMGETHSMPPDARANRQRWETMGEVEALSLAAFRARPESDIYIDAIFGTGLTRAPDGDLLEVLRYLGGSGGDAVFFTPRLVAVDAPSGLDLDSGRMLAGGRPEPFSATVPLCSLTVTFEVPKVGHFLAHGPDCCGRLEVVDLGLRKWRSVRRDAKTGEIGEQGKPVLPRAQLIDRDPLVSDGWGARHAPPMFAKTDGHKYAHGHALVVSGPATRTGAARLAARAALRIGAGLVTVASPSDALAENAAHLTALMVRRCDGARELSELLEDDRFNSVCLGPGMGVGAETRAAVLAAIDGQRRVVLDADALTSFENEPDQLFQVIRDSQGKRDFSLGHVALTPHAGEFRRLFPDLAEAWQPARNPRPAASKGAGAEDTVQINEQRMDQLSKGPTLSKIDAVREAAKRSGAVVLLKGPDTVIASPSGQASIHAAAYDRKTPWLATAGAGDVLAGFITGLAARRPVLHDVVGDAAWLHVEAARVVGPGMIAEDLPEAVPAVLRDLIGPDG